MKKQQSIVPATAGAKSSASLDFAGGRAALTEANRHTDILYTSLAGVAGIVLVLLIGLALPVFGYAPMTSLTVFIIMVVTAMVGVIELCFINFRAHRHVTRQALLTEVLLNSLGQGFLSFDAEGKCGPVYSQACLDLLEVAPAGLDIADVLKLPQDQRNDFKDWIDMLFRPDHALGFDDLVNFFPQIFAHSRGRHIVLMYRPVYDKNDLLLNIVMIATDQTEEAEAQLRARMQQNFVNMICLIFKERNQFLTTITHLRTFIQDSRQPVKQIDSTTILRLLHTLKAAAKHFHLEALNEVIHRLEMELRTLGSDQKFQERLSKGGDEVEACLNAVLEQVGDLIGQDYEGRGNLHELDENTIYGFARLMREKRIDPELIRQYLLSIAAVPVNETFRQFERELKDLAEIMGKRVKPIRYSGSNPRVLAQPLEALQFSMMHICRNIIDHGIEPVITRLARGKEPAGLVTIDTDLVETADPAKRMLRIVISDDGNGIDPALVRAKLATIDPHGDWKDDNDDEVIQRILLWEVSTKNEVTDLSGRGVGMEAVDREIKFLGGTIRVQSELYKGTTFDVRIPYNLDAPVF